MEINIGHTSISYVQDSVEAQSGINYEQDSVETRLPNESGLLSLSEMAKLQITLEDEFDLISRELATIGLRLKQVSEVEIPDKMLELGVSEFKLEDGTKITVSPFYSASIKDEVKEDAFKYLRDNGFGDIIKHEVVSAFKMGEDKKAEELKLFLAKNKFIFDDKETVHAQTLKKFVKEQITADETASFPRELFGVYEGKKTKITRRKSK